MKIFVWHQGAVGDLVLSFPSLWSIRRHFEDSTVLLTCRTDLSDIVIKNNLADEVLSNEKGLFADLFIDGKSPPPPGEELLSGFDAAFVFTRNPDSCFLKNLRRYIPHCVSIPTVPPEGSRMHVSDFQLSELQTAGIHRDLPMPVLEATDNSSGVSRDKEVIALHPGSGGQKKCWPLHRYLEFVSVMHTLNAYYFLILLGPAEGDDTAKKIERFLLESGPDAGIIREEPLSAVAGRLKISSLYLGNDSGITHLSAALGTPTIAVFGPTDHLKWGPKGDVRIVSSDLACSPCRGDDQKRCRDVRCLLSVSVENVIAAAQNMLNAGVRGVSAARRIRQ